MPRSAIGDWVPARARKHPIRILDGQARSRIAQLVPIRYERMAQSPFAFFRGAAAIMAMDLASAPVTGLRVQACGDAHLGNFGKFATPERNLVFDLNDFDETIPGPWEWDLARLAASLHVVARQLGFKPEACSDVVMAAARAYRKRVRELAKLHTLDVWYERTDVEDVLAHFPAKHRPLVERDVKRAMRKDRRRAVAKLTHDLHGELRLADDPPLIVHFDETGHDRGDVAAMFAAYRKSLSHERRALVDHFRVVDVARKVVGVGSVGTCCWICLLEGPDRPGGDHLVLQVKEAQPSALAPYVGASTFAHEGERVVVGQRLTQAASDVLLGWCTAPSTKRQYYVRQLWDSKGSSDPLEMDPERLGYYGALCALALARAHARSGSAVEIGSYLGKSDAFDRALAHFAATYAVVNERDHAALRESLSAGRIT